MTTAERIAWGLLSLIVLIVWLRWRTAQDQRKDGPPQLPKRSEENAKHDLTRYVVF